VLPSNTVILTNKTKVSLNNNTNLLWLFKLCPATNKKDLLAPLNAEVNTLNNSIALPARETSSPELKPPGVSDLAFGASAAAPLSSLPSYLAVLMV